MKALGFSRMSSGFTTYHIKVNDHSEDRDLTLIVIKKILRADTRDDGVRRQDQDPQEELLALHVEEPIVASRLLTLLAKRMFRALRVWRKPKDLNRPKREALTGCVACW